MNTAEKLRDKLNKTYKYIYNKRKLEMFYTRSSTSADEGVFTSNKIFMAEVVIIMGYKKKPNT